MGRLPISFPILKKSEVIQARTTIIAVGLMEAIESTFQQHKLSANGAGSVNSSTIITAPLEIMATMSQPERERKLRIFLIEFFPKITDQNGQQVTAEQIDKIASEVSRNVIIRY